MEFIWYEIRFLLYSLSGFDKENLRKRESDKEKK
jgi:hypothetical protein